MKASLLTKLETLTDRHQEVSALLSDSQTIANQNKFRDLCGGLLGAQGCDRALKALWQLESIKDAGAITALLVPHKS